MLTKMAAQRRFGGVPESGGYREKRQRFPDLTGDVGAAAV